MNETKSTKKRNPPYLPTGVLEQFIRKMRIVNIPDEVSTKTLRAWNVAPGQEYHLRSALGFLGLIDEEGKPTAEFAKIQVEGSQWESNLREIVQKAYSDVFRALKMEHAKYDDLANFFGQYSQVSKHKMVKAFSYLCKLAGINSPAFDQPPEKTKAPVVTKKEKRAKPNVPERPDSKKTEKMPTVGGRNLGHDWPEIIKALENWDLEGRKLVFDTMVKIEGKKHEEKEEK